MSEMIERVAAVLWSIHPGGSEWSEIKEADSPIVRLTRQQAVAVIEAMREPTEAMITAGYYHVYLGYTDQSWRAMIDAALKTA